MLKIGLYSVGQKTTKEMPLRSENPKAVSRNADIHPFLTAIAVCGIP
jgi:hypothetical protein